MEEKRTYQATRASLAKPRVWVLAAFAAIVLAVLLGWARVPPSAFAEDAQKDIYLDAPSQEDLDAAVKERMVESDPNSIDPSVSNPLEIEALMLDSTQSVIHAVVPTKISVAVSIDVNGSTFKDYLSSPSSVKNLKESHLPIGVSIVNVTDTPPIPSGKGILQFVDMNLVNEQRGVDVALHDSMDPAALFERVDPDTEAEFFTKVTKKSSNPAIPAGHYATSVIMKVQVVLD